MSSNFVKGGYVVVNKDKNVTIDNNAIIKKKLEEIRAKQVGKEELGHEDTEGFSEGLDPIEVQRLVADTDGEDGEGFSEGFTEGLGSTGIVKSPERQKILDAENEAAQIIEKATMEADEIKENARTDGYEAGKKEGYEAGHFEGKASAEREIEEKKAELQNDFDARIRDLEMEYKSKSDMLESAIVDKLTGIYEQVLGISIEGKRDTIIYLLKKSLGDIDPGRSLIIHVSRDDFPTVYEKKDELCKAAGIGADSLEIIEDHTLSENGCLIETETGIFDTGLDTQLNLLKKQLKLLSLQA